MSGEDRAAYLSEAEASRLWKRAAELQLKASQRTEELSRELQSTPGPTGLVHGEHVRIDDVLGAGREVGIDDDFLETALAEILEERASGLAPPLDVLERLAVRFLGNPPLVVEAARLIPAPPSSVYPILQRILPEPPLQLRLRQTLGSEPLRDGVLIFDAPAGVVRPASYAREVLMARGRIPRISVTTRSVTGRTGVSTRVTIRGRVEADHEPAFWGGSMLTGGSAVVGAVLGALAAPGLGLVGTAALGSALGVGVLAGGVAYWLHRSRYLNTFQRSSRAMQELLEVVEASVRTRGGFLPARSGSGSDERGVAEDRIDS